jgi:hypothetical protein
MPLVKRKRSLLDIPINVMGAPFVFLFVNFVMAAPFLVLGLILLLFCMWMAGEPLSAHVPTKETIYLLLGTIVGIALAAIPLAIRDYFANGGYDTVWERTPECIQAGETYANLVLTQQYESLYAKFSEHLRTERTLSELCMRFEAISKSVGPPVAVNSVDEDVMSQPTSTEEDGGDDVDGILRIVFDHENDNQSVLVLFLNCNRAFEVVELLYIERTDEH